MKHNYVRLVFWSSAYTFRYLSQSSSRIIAIFKNRERLGNPQSDWVSGSSWGSPIVRSGPPVLEGLND